MTVSALFRSLPSFKGKRRLADLLLRTSLFQNYPFEFRGKRNIIYKVPNTIDGIGRGLLIDGIYEEETITRIEKLLPTGGTYFDIGANIGAILIPIAKKYHGVFPAVIAKCVEHFTEQQS